MTVADLVWEIKDFYGSRKGTQPQTAEKFGIRLSDARKTTRMLDYIHTVTPLDTLEKVVIREADFSFLNKYI